MMYLYVKTHAITGLKYLGYTKSKDPHLYKGSGVYWVRHLREHGCLYTTDILLATDNKEELRETGLFFSSLWQVDKSTEWANLCLEEGQGGNTGDYSGRQTKAKDTMLKKYGVPHYSLIPGAMDRSIEIRTQTMQSKYGVDNFSQTDEFKSKVLPKIKYTTRMRYGVDNVAASPEIKKKISETKLSNDWVQINYKQCPHCDKLVEPGNYARWHGDKCNKKF